MEEASQDCLFRLVAFGVNVKRSSEQSKYQTLKPEMTLNAKRTYLRWYRMHKSAKFNLKNVGMEQKKSE